MVISRPVGINLLPYFVFHLLWAWQRDSTKWFKYKQNSRVMVTMLVVNACNTTMQRCFCTILRSHIHQRNKTSRVCNFRLIFCEKINRAGPLVLKSGWFYCHCLMWYICIIEVYIITVIYYHHNAFKSWISVIDARKSNQYLFIKRQGDIPDCYT